MTMLGFKPLVSFSVVFLALVSLAYKSSASVYTYTYTGTSYNYGNLQGRIIVSFTTNQPLPPNWGYSGDVADQNLISNYTITDGVHTYKSPTNGFSYQGLHTDGGGWIGTDSSGNITSWDLAGVVDINVDTSPYYTMATGSSGNAQYPIYDWTNYFVPSAGPYIISATGGSTEVGTWTMTSDNPQLLITGISSGDVCYLGEKIEDGRSVVIPLQASVVGSVTGSISWTISINYISPITLKQFRNTVSIVLDPAQCVGTSHQLILSGVGGDATVSASGIVDGQSVTDSVNCSILGYKVDHDPIAPITSELLKLYGPLLAGVADTESSYSTGYGQFFHKSPLINRSGVPQAVGLMQDDVLSDPTDLDNLGTYFDWRANAREGADIFKSKVSYVHQTEAKILRDHPTMPGLREFQVQNWALSRYKGFSDKVYVPNINYNGWIVNPNLNPRIPGRVNAVRAKAHAITHDMAVDRSEYLLP